MAEKTLSKTELKTLMQEQLSKLNKKIEVLKDLTQAIAPDDSIGRVSRMDAINNKSVNEAALRQSEIKYNKLSEAIQRIDDPDFGVCIKCGKNIQYGRIILMPESKLCVTCAAR